MCQNSKLAKNISNLSKNRRHVTLYYQVMTNIHLGIEVIKTKVPKENKTNDQTNWSFGWPKGPKPSQNDQDQYSTWKGTKPIGLVLVIWSLGHLVSITSTWKLGCMNRTCCFCSIAVSAVSFSGRVAAMTEHTQKSSVHAMDLTICKPAESHRQRKSLGQGQKNHV